MPDLPKNPGPFSSADLPIHNGRVYHLDLRPEDLAQNIVIVGDPHRVTLLAKSLSHVEVDREHRGFHTVTGVDSKTGVRVTYATSLVGTPSLEVVLGEIFILNEIDLVTRMRHPSPHRLNIIRLGTSGGIQESTKLGTIIITDHAIGLDNSGLFWNVPQTEDENALAERVQEALKRAAAESGNSDPGITPYVSSASPEVVEALARAADELHAPYKIGSTVSHAGFFASQGRNILRTPPSVLDIDYHLSLLPALDNGSLIENFEMETSLLCRLGKSEGHWVGAACITVANRRLEQFTSSYLEDIARAGEVVLRAFKILEERN